MLLNRKRKNIMTNEELYHIRALYKMLIERKEEVLKKVKNIVNL